MKLFIQNFPDDLHRALKIQAAKDEKSLYKLIIDILRSYMNDKKI